MNSQKNPGGLCLSEPLRSAIRYPLSVLGAQRLSLSAFQHFSVSAFSPSRPSVPRYRREALASSLKTEL
jgi:hypothetical protein